MRFHGDVERAKSVYKGIAPLLAEDIADNIVYLAIFSLPLRRLPSLSQVCCIAPGPCAGTVFVYVCVCACVLCIRSYMLACAHVQRDFGADRVGYESSEYRDHSQGDQVNDLIFIGVSCMCAAFAVAVAASRLPFFFFCVCVWMP